MEGTWNKLYVTSAASQWTNCHMKFTQITTYSTTENMVITKMYKLYPQKILIHMQYSILCTDFLLWDKRWWVANMSYCMHPFISSYHSAEILEILHRSQNKRADKKKIKLGLI